MITPHMTTFARNPDLINGQLIYFSVSVYFIEGMAIHTSHACSKMDIPIQPVLFGPINPWRLPPFNKWRPKTSVKVLFE
jgi:hypothetical protein